MSFKNTFLPTSTLLQSNGNLLSLDKVSVMGIINITTDSFYAPSRANNENVILQKVEKMIEEGASIIDIGAMSSRPNDASLINTDDESKLICNTVSIIRKHFKDVWISVDTFRASIAKCAVQEGANMINDISGGRFDAYMLPQIAQLSVPYIAMHLCGNFETMHQAFNYTDVNIEVLEYFQNIITQCNTLGIKDLIIDPGFGFSKNVYENYKLLNKMSILRILQKPILVGLSRKSFIYKNLNTDANHALNGTTALNMVALQQGATILRVHDVKEAMECIKLYNLLS